MKRPSLQFYPADWKANAKLRRCSESARGAWLDILCLFHDSDDYGLCYWTLEDVARSAGAALRSARELAKKGVLKGADEGPVEYIHTPRHAGQDGDPVTLLKTQGPCWFSSRMLRDEWLRSRRGGATKFTSDNQPNRSPEPSPNRRVGEPVGDGASSSTSSSQEEYNSNLRLESSDPPKPSPIKARKKQPEEPEGFQQFYETYPRRVRRRAAAKAFRSALARATLEEILTGTARASIEAVGKHQEFIAHPATWLNADGWKDEPATKEQTNGRVNGQHKATATDKHLAGIASLITDIRSNAR